MLKVTIQPVNPVFREHVLKYVSEIEDPKYTFVGTERYGTYVFDCSSDSYWVAVDSLKAALRRPPIADAMFCQVKPYGMYTWPPLFDKGRYPRP